MKLCKDAQTTQLREYRTQRVPGQKNGAVENREIRANPTNLKSGEWVDANVPILPVNFLESLTAQACFTPVSYRCASTALETTRMSSWLPRETIGVVQFAGNELFLLWLNVSLFSRSVGV